MTERDDCNACLILLSQCCTQLWTGLVPAHGSRVFSRGAGVAGAGGVLATVMVVLAEDGTLSV